MPSAMSPYSLAVTPGHIYSRASSVPFGIQHICCLPFTAAPFMQF